MDGLDDLAGTFARGEWLRAGGAEVEAATIAHILCAPPDPAAGWPRPALRLTQARITGRLDLSFCEVTPPILLEDCDFDEVPHLYWARLGFASFRRSRLPGMSASNVTVHGHLRLVGCRFTGPVDLKGAKLHGGLLLGGAEFIRPGRVAIDAERAEIGGDVQAGSGFRAEGSIRMFQANVTGGIHLDGAAIDGTGAGTEDNPADNKAVDLDSATIRGGFFARDARITGEVSLRHATVGGVVTLSRATISNPGAVALRMDRADIRGGVFLQSGCHVLGETRMVSTSINRTLRLTGAVLDNPGGHALLADGLSTDGSLDARHGFVSRGKISLVEARIAGPIHFEGAFLDNPGDISLRAVGIVAGAIFNCCDGFTATGRVSVSAARVAGRLCFDRADLTATPTALKCARVEAAELSLQFATAPAGAVDLRHARVAILRDNPPAWPLVLHLDGLTYQTLEPTLPPARRLDWLGRMPEGLPPQPYEELAAIYRRLGHDEYARMVLLVKQRRQAKTARRITRAWGWLQDATVGYGYRPQRALLWLAALLLIGSVTFGLNPPEAVAGSGGPRFNPVLYTLDLLLPVVTVGQEEHYSPAPGQQWLAYLLIAAGWTLATTAAAGFSRAASRA